MAKTQKPKEKKTDWWDRRAKNVEKTKKASDKKES